jgi:hypothetical protein
MSELRERLVTLGRNAITDGFCRWGTPDPMPSESEIMELVELHIEHNADIYAALLPKERAPNIETLLRRVGEGDHYAPEVSWDNDRKAWNVEWLHMRGLRVAAVISDTGYPWAAILNGERLHGTDLDGLMAALDKYDAIVDTTKA